MTELQIGLIGLGVIAVGGVLAYNKWQEIRQRKQTESVLRSSHRDVLFDGGIPVLPGPGAEAGESGGQSREMAALLTTGVFPAAGDPVTDDARIEPVFTEPKITAAPEPAAPTSASSPKPAAASQGSGSGSVGEDSLLLSPLIDFIAAIDTVEPVPARRIVDASKEALARVHKPVLWIGRDGTSGEWQPVSAQTGGDYRKLRAGLQLVDRQGPIGEDELTIFATAMRDLADQLSGIAELPALQDTYATAVALDRFCASVDIQIGINVISQGQAFAGTQIRALSEAAGMAIENRRFARRDDDGNVLYTLLNQDAAGFSEETMSGMSTHGLTFLLDVPCVTNGKRVFVQMTDLARRFADVLRGALVDDNRHPLSEAAFEPIGRQIAQYQALLAEQRLPAGSALTRRLFS
ncbi:MAG: cell division protein ZipA C-terminal FtsZ-binding domain-containing protein [Candidatus Accumulibacter sp.]|jgi:hypothetical protein|nr:cell division protein ZipA C-terminal FtsZ-binding domain-containing protein [Accumulibacter sp.]